MATHKLLHEQNGQRTFIVVFETGEEVISGLTAFARQRAPCASHFTAIGALSRARLGYFDWQRKHYREIPVEEQVEVLSLAGDIADYRGEPKVHAHVVLGRSDATALGGHLLQAHVRPTLELVLVDSPRTLQRWHDPATGLALIRP
jgi:hypothetical protein